jgi:hypothetical protein
MRATFRTSRMAVPMSSGAGLPAGRPTTMGAGSEAMTPKPRGRDKGAWWIQTVETEWLPTLAAARFPTVPDGHGCLVWSSNSLDGASPLGDWGRPTRWQGRRR